MVKKPRIFMVDDDEDLLMITKLVLEAAGYEFASARSGEEAMGKMGEVNPDLVILDVMMEDDYAGFRVVNALRADEKLARFSKVPILMLTSVQKHTKMKFAKDAGTGLLPVECFLEKPVKPADLVAKVSELLKKA